MSKYIKSHALTLVVASVFMLAGCNKKIAKTVPPQTPPVAAPTATLAAYPEVIQQGQSTELTWSTSNADSISIEGLGTVSASGSRSVTPGNSMTYTLIAQGPGGTREAAARVTVNPLAATRKTSASETDVLARNFKDVYFDYDHSSLRSDQETAVQHDATFLLQHPEMKVLIEGHCDNRGSEEYNLALGDSRANTLKNSLLAQGVNAEQIKTISYGKEHPFCSQDNEQCWQENRRDHLSPQQ